MPKHILNWKPVRSKNVRGEPYLCRTPETLDVIYRGTLLTHILKMKRRNPISLTEAIHRANEHWNREFQAGRPREADYYLDHFVEWLEGEGYHIELTGDEFEPAWMTDKPI